MDKKIVALDLDMINLDADEFGDHVAQAVHEITHSSSIVNLLTVKLSEDACRVARDNFLEMLNSVLSNQNVDNVIVLPIGYKGCPIEDVQVQHLYTVKQVE